MICEKTGCVAYHEQYDEWLYGDAFVADGGNNDREPDPNGLLLIRVSMRTKAGPLRGNVVHYTIHESTQWFDKDRKDGCSTLISEDYSWHGRNGKEIEK